VFTAATVVVGFAVRLPQTETSRLPFTVGQMTPDPMVVQMSLVDVLAWLVAACWAVAAFNVVRHLRTRRYSRPLETGVLWEMYRHRRPDEVRKILVRDIARADKHNREILAHKAHLLNAAVLATGLESLFLVVAVILTR